MAARRTYRIPKMRFGSHVTGKLAGDEITAHDYWVRHVRQAVRFADGVQTLHEQGIGIFLEIGPKPVLLGMAAQVVSGQWSADRNQQSAVSHPITQLPDHLITLPHSRENHPYWQQMLTSLGALYGQGVAFDWAGVDQWQPRLK